MPLPFGDGSFPACVAHFTGKGDDSDTAHKKCGAIEANLASAVATIISEYDIKTASGSWLENSKLTADLGKDQLFEKNGKKFAKIFLISEEANMKQWQVTPESIPKRIRTFIGRPFISEPGLAHFDTDSLSVDRILAKQEQYRAGTIRDVVTTGSLSYAIVEFADNTLGNRTWKEMLEGKAIYSSPAVAGFSVDTNGKRIFHDWFGLHLARVANPAYGVFHASLKQTCIGPEKQCMDTLIASASAYVVNDITSQVSEKPHCSKMATPATAMDFEHMTEEEKKKKLEEMNATLASANAKIKELETKVAAIPGSEGLNSINITDPVPPNEIRAEQGAHDRVVQPNSAAATKAELDRLSKVVAGYEAEKKSTLIDKIITMKASVDLVTASNEATERDQLSKLSNEQLQSKATDFEPIIEKMQEMRQSSGIPESAEGRQIVMPKSASAAADQKPSNLSEIRSNWF